MTGGSSFRNASVSRSITWLAQIMRWVLMTAFGLPVEPEVSRNFAIVSGPMASCTASRRGCNGVAIRSASIVTSRPGTAPRDAAISVPEETLAASASANFVGVVGEHEARRQQLHQIAELAVIPRHQRIGRRYRTEGNAGIERAERDQRMIDRVAGENDDRLLGRKAARQQRGGDVPRRGQQLRIGDLPPAPCRVRAPP